MDRPSFLGSRRLVEGLILLSVVLSTGCRSTRSEVPLGKPYARTGDQVPTVGFSSQPHPEVAGSMPASVNIGPGGLMQDRLAGAGPNASVYGTPTASEKVAMPTENRYGPPGTSGLDPSAGASPSDISKALMDTGESTAKSLGRDLGVKQASGPPQ